jgi:hypothetical protein
MLFSAAFNSDADIIAGPITNPTNGQDYYLLAPNSWTASEAEAENLGGTLAIITNAGEQDWVVSQFGSYGGTKHDLWIGIRRQSPGGPFVCVTGAKPDYVNWCPGQPDNGGGIEDCVQLWMDDNHGGSWNDAPDFTHQCGVVEMPSKSNPQTLTETEKSLIGTWYFGGRIDQPCYFAGTSNMLFAIGNYGRSARIIYTTTSHIFAASWHAHGEIVQDKILWSDGTWWSRMASNYTSGAMPQSSEIQMR